MTATPPLPGPPGEVETIDSSRAPEPPSARASHELIHPPEPLELLVDEFLTWLAVDRGRSVSTVAAYRRDLTVFQRFVHGQGMPLGEASPAVIDAHLDALASAGARPASVVRALAAIRGVYRFAVDELHVPVDPTASVRGPRAPDRLPKALTEDEVACLLDSVAPTDPLGRRDRAILEVLYGTGMRVGELVGLRTGDLGSETGLVRVLGKGRKERLVPLGGLAARALEDWLGPGGRPQLVPARWARRHDADAVFLNARGGRITRQGVWDVIGRRAAAAGLGSAVHPHVLRHSCATHMLGRGADIRVVQELLGHVSVATTQLYTKVTVEHLRRAYEQAHPRAGGARRQ